ncbi:MAG: 3-dehydroquinate synthase [Oscillospiraceae bacterium]|nr:3-dehydroquinate synthase [Oscillospiraceae bacterium]
MKIISSNTVDNYNIFIENNSFEKSIEIISKLTTTKKIIIICDKKVYNIYQKNITTIFNNKGYKIYLYCIPAKENNKTYSTIINIHKFLFDNNISRDDIIVCIGGGILSDIVGFASSSYKRGIKYINIPTTLLSQVDASVGGKTGVNTQYGKNTIGCFYSPSAVIIDKFFLNTLNQTQFKNGLSEIIKIGVINNKSIIDIILNKNYEKNIEELIYKSILSKRNIVQQDPRDIGMRRILNFGHTIGHSLEKHLNFKIPHGYAVAIGMSMITKKSEKLGITKPYVYEHLINIIKSVGLPNNIKVSMEDIYINSLQDKKIENNKFNLILIDDFQSPMIKSYTKNEYEKFLFKGHL